MANHHHPSSGHLPRGAVRGRIRQVFASDPTRTFTIRELAEAADLPLSVASIGSVLAALAAAGELTRLEPGRYTLAQHGDGFRNPARVAAEPGEGGKWKQLATVGVHVVLAGPDGDLWVARRIELTV